MAGTLFDGRAERVVGRNAKNSCADRLEPLGRNDLIRSWQAIILPFSLKRAAEEQDTTRQAVENQRNGDSAASLLAAINMARANPRVRAQLGALMGFRGCYTDPDFMEGMEKLAQGYVRQQFSSLTFVPDASPHDVDAIATSLNSAGGIDDLTGDLFGAAGSA